MKKLLIIIAFVVLALPNQAETLSLDSCRAMALRNNKHLNATKLQKEVAANTRKAVRTNYLPKIEAIGGYQYSSKTMSLLNDEQKATLAGLGTNSMSTLSTSISQVLAGLAGGGLISPQIAKDLGTIMTTLSEPLAEAGNAIGQNISDAFKTDTHNIWAGSVMLRQPVFMGGAIVAANKMADIAEEMAATTFQGEVENTIYSIDQTYWLVVSLKQKKKLAESYRDLVKKLDEDVKKLIKEGFATRADGLKVDVKVNEADMAVTKVDNGLTLAKMLLCQLCGIPVESQITLADEDNVELNIYDDTPALDNSVAQENRTELKLLQNAVDMSRQSTNLVRSAYLPHVLLTGGYMISNPNCFNGFQNKFGGAWNIGVAVQIPVWNWLEGVYKVRATKTATTIAGLELSDAQEKINLQVTQCRFKVGESHKHLNTAVQNLKNAEENLRCANVGFREGVMESTEVMAAQTAWQAAQTQKIDAEIDVKLSQLELKKALGVLQ